MRPFLNRTLKLRSLPIIPDTAENAISGPFPSWLHNLSSGGRGVLPMTGTLESMSANQLRLFLNVKF